MGATKITPAAVAQSVVQAGRSFMSAREAAAAASADYRAAALCTAEALASGVQAKEISAAIKAAIGDDRALAREVQSSVPYVTMLGRVGKVLALPGDMPAMPLRKGQTAKDADVMGPRDVYTIVRRAQQNTGGAAAVDAACETETIASAVDAIRAFIARAERSKSAATPAPKTAEEPTAEEPTAEAAEDVAPVTPEPDALALVREAAASVEAAAVAGLNGESLALALALADRLADIFDTYSAEDVKAARASLAA